MAILLKGIFIAVSYKLRNNITRRCHFQSLLFFLQACMLSSIFNYSIILLSAWTHFCYLTWFKFSHTMDFDSSWFKKSSWFNIIEAILLKSVLGIDYIAIANWYWQNIQLEVLSARKVPFIVLNLQDLVVWFLGFRNLAALRNSDFCIIILFLCDF